MDRSSPPRIAVASLGGTITMTGDDGVTPTLSASDLVAAVPRLAEVAHISHHTVAVVPGASLGFTDLTRLLRWAAQEIDAGATGVVVAQGTDTIEETAYFADLHWSRPEPLVVTGAMRPPAALSADGPANVLAAVLAAADPGARDRGVLVVLDETIHLAPRVRKEHASRLSAFASSRGPAGAVVEGAVTWYAPPGERRAALALPDESAAPWVAAIGTGLGEDGRTLRTLVGSGADGVVVAALGVGHVSARLAAAIEESAPVPVVVASRTGGGRTFHGTYGFDGSERDLQRRGALLGDWLDPAKARILLWSLLAAGVTGDRLKDDFASAAAGEVRGAGSPGSRNASSEPHNGSMSEPRDGSAT